MNNQILDNNDKDMKPKTDPRKELLSKLGEKCIKCGEQDTKILQIDHILGQGYIEKEFFKNRQKMFEQYLKEFKLESEYLQVLCFNCNVKKRHRYRESKDRPNAKDFAAFTKVSPEDVVEMLHNYPQTRPLWERQVRMIKRTFDEAALERGFKPTFDKTI